MLFTKWRLITAGVFLVAMIVLNAIPSRARAQTADENAEVLNSPNAPCTIQNWGWPMPLYSHFGGGGYISPWNMLPSEATPIFSEWRIIGLIIDGLIVLTGLVLILCVRLPGLPGEGQENVEIIRDSDEGK